MPNHRLVALGRQGKGIQEDKFAGWRRSPARRSVLRGHADRPTWTGRTVRLPRRRINVQTALKAGAYMRNRRPAATHWPRGTGRCSRVPAMLDDASLGNEVKTVIKTGQWAQGALRQVVTDHVNRFEMMDDAYLRERASDVRDLGRRLLAYLQEDRTTNLVYPDNTILISEELSHHARRSAEGKLGPFPPPPPPPPPWVVSGTPTGDPPGHGTRR